MNMQTALPVIGQLAGFRDAFIRLFDYSLK